MNATLDTTASLGLIERRKRIVALIRTYIAVSQKLRLYAAQAVDSIEQFLDMHKDSKDDTLGDMIETELAMWRTIIDLEDKLRRDARILSSAGEQDLPPSQVHLLEKSIARRTQQLDDLLDKLDKLLDQQTTRVEQSGAHRNAA